MGIREGRRELDLVIVHDLVQSWQPGHEDGDMARDTGFVNSSRSGMGDDDIGYMELSRESLSGDEILSRQIAKARPRGSSLDEELDIRLVRE